MKIFLLIIASFALNSIQSQIIKTAAGTTAGSSAGDGGLFSSATFSGPAHMTYDKAGNLYFSDRRIGKIRKVDAVSGIVTTLVSGLSTPLGIAFNRQEIFLYIAENSCIYQLNMATNALSVFAGIPGQLCSSFYLCGEGGLATNAILDNPGGVAVDSIGNVYIADNGNSRVRKVDIATRIITTYAGGGSGGGGSGPLGDGGPATMGSLLFPVDVRFDNKGDLIICDGGLHNIRKVNSTTGIISTISGATYGGGWGYSGDGGLAVNARLLSPQGIFIDKNDNLYIADAGNSAIRRIDKTGIITTIAGNGTSGYSGDCGPAVNAQLNTPTHAIVTPGGSILVGDYRNNVFREVLSAAPNIITASTNSLCVSSTLILQNSASGGVWQTNNPSVATVNSNGLVTGISPGTANISYYIANGCNTNTATFAITVYSIPPKPQITGSSNVCEASTINLATSIPGGSWSSSDSLIAYSDANGLTKGISPGVVTLKYTVSNSICFSRDSTNITVIPLPKVVPILGDTTVCINSTSSLTNSSVGGVWSTSNSSIVSINSTNGLIGGISAGQAIITYTVNNSCGFVTATTKIKVNSLPYFSLGIDTSICVNGNIILDPLINAILYTWEDGSKLKVRVIDRPGDFSVKVVDSNQCSFSDTITIKSKQLPALSLGRDTTLCNNLTYDLSVQNGSILNYRWQDGTVLPTYSIRKAGQYSVTVSGINGCANSDTINVNYLRSPIFSLGGDATICPGNPIIIDPQLSNVSYLWQDSSTKSTFTVTKEGLYSLKATNFCGSTLSTVEFKKGLCRLEMPTAFTPNNDGKNDVFRVKYPDFIKSFHFLIYNRWGQIIFETKDGFKGWNGKYKSIEQDPGNYVWKITYTDLQNITETATGSVLLVR